MSEESVDADGTDWGHVVLGTGGLLVLGALFVVAGDFAAVGAMIPGAVDNEYLLAMVLGAIALLLGAVMFLTGHDHIETASMPAVEQPVPASTPGDSLEAQLGGLRAWVPLLGTSVKTEARTRLRRAAVLAVVADRGCRNGEATQVVNDGSWTDDPVAAGFLSTGGRRSLGAVVAAAIRRQTPLEYRVRRTIHVLAALGQTGETVSS